MIHRSFLIELNTTPHIAFNCIPAFHHIVYYLPPLLLFLLLLLLFLFLLLLSNSSYLYSYLIPSIITYTALLTHTVQLLHWFLTSSTLNSSIASAQWPERKYCSDTESFFLCKLWENFGSRSLGRMVRFCSLALLSSFSTYHTPPLCPLPAFL